MERIKATKHLRELLDSQGLSHWHVRLLADFNKPFLGMCDYRSKTIILNAFRIDTHPDIEILNTIAHEVAHALCPSHGHDAVWEAKSRELGDDNPAPCVTYSLDDRAIDAIRSGDMLEISYKEQVVRTPQYKVSKLVDRCPTCDKIAVTEKISEIKIGKKFKRITRLQCGHLISEEIAPISPFESLVFDGDNSCNHKWNKTTCEACGAHKLFPFQIEGAKAIEKHNGRFAILDEPGLGKTIQALAYLKFHPESFPVLWVTRSSAKYQHGKEILRILGIMPQIINTGFDKPYPGFKIFICSYDIFRRQDIEVWKKHGIKTIVLDEVQAVKNPDSTRTQCIRKLIRDKDPNDDNKWREIKNVIPLSGSFWKNRGSEAFVMLNLLDPKMFGSFQAFKDYHVDYYWHGSKKKEAGLKDPKKFLEKIAHIGLRRERKEVMPELPLINRTKFLCELDKASQEVYTEEKDKLIDIFNNAAIGGEEDSFKVKQQMQASLMVMRQIVGIAKVPTTLDLAQEFMEECDRKLVIFVHHIACGEMIFNGMSKWCAENDVPQPLHLTGSMTAEDRGIIQDKFNSNEYRLMIASTLASGEAINLQTCSDCIMHERQWNPMNEEQAEGRFIRIGQTANAVNATYVHANEIVDTRLDEIVSQKRSWFNSSMNKGAMEVWNESNMIDELVKALVRSGK